MWLVKLFIYPLSAGQFRKYKLLLPGQRRLGFLLVQRIFTAQVRILRNVASILHKREHRRGVNIKGRSTEHCFYRCYVCRENAVI
ncbi:hypothetical protein NMG60_11014130 [Bertholletia excelsa]